MKYPNLKEEKRLWQKGYRVVTGLDEAGRGCLAGPVVAAAVTMPAIFNFQFSIFNQFSILKKIKDSKQLTPKRREKFYKILVDSQWLEWGIGVVSNKVIDKINILEATKLAMKKAIINLSRKIPTNKKPTIVGKLSNSHDRRNLVKPVGVDYLILDGNFRLNIDIPQKSIVKGDEKVFSCAAASILAKVTRDRMMIRYHKKYPRYRFDLHKGYGTRLHLRMLKKHRPCPIHRKSFQPVRALEKV